MNLCRTKSLPNATLEAKLKSSRRFMDGRLDIVVVLINFYNSQSIF